MPVLDQTTPSPCINRWNMHGWYFVKVQKLRQLLRVGPVVLVLGAKDQSEVAGMCYDHTICDRSELVVKPSVVARRFVAHAEWIIEIPQPIDRVAWMTFDRLALDYAAVGPRMQRAVEC